MTPRELAKQAAAVAGKAAKGPWEAHERDIDWYVSGPDSPKEPYIAYVEWLVGDPASIPADAAQAVRRNHAFIAAARTLVPDLAAALERACELLEALDVPNNELPYENDSSDVYCPKCTADSTWPGDFEHSPDCPHLAARAFLAREVSE